MEEAWEFAAVSEGGRTEVSLKPTELSLSTDTAALEKLVSGVISFSPLHEISGYFSEVLRGYRIRAAARTVQEAKKLLEDIGVKPFPIELKKLVPLLESASLEDITSEGQLTDLWAGLLASESVSADPSTILYIDILRRMNAAQRAFLEKHFFEALDYEYLEILAIKRQKVEVRQAFDEVFGVNFNTLINAEVILPLPELPDLARARFNFNGHILSFVKLNEKREGDRAVLMGESEPIVMDSPLSSSELDIIYSMIALNILQRIDVNFEKTVLFHTYSCKVSLFRLTRVGHGLFRACTGIRLGNLVCGT